MYFKNVVFFVLGLSKSGLAISKLLLKKGAKVIIFDNSSSDAVKKNVEMLIAEGAVYAENLEDAINMTDVLVLSPAVPLDNDIAVNCKKAGKRIIGELELASYFITNPIVAVTGTNGKTTTCSMIEHVLNMANIKSETVGNIGTPLSERVGKIDEDEILVCEVSSYQLETTFRFTPHIACVLNITPDHLARHYNMGNYIYVKSKIVSTLRESEYAVLNYDDENVKDFANRTRGKVVYFSMKEKINGAYLSDGKLFYNDDFIMNESELSLKGSHNTENALCAICVCRLLGLKDSEILSGLHSFKGVKHRIEYVKEYKGISFYNDSKATNSDATLKAVESMNGNVNLILGGFDKGIPFDEMFEKLKGTKKIKRYVLTGQTADNMYLSAKKLQINNISLVPDFQAAIITAFGLSEKGDSILFSPSVSSFDLFSNYEERGERFIEIVKKITE